MTRYLCVHGHFYQPPRENPWLDDVEVQESATPFHDWNERITHECYEANAWSRILDRDELIERIVNNYAKISFNFGPTLLSWMDRHAPQVVDALKEADRLSTEKFSGHGSAMAQAHGHIIMPLASPRDKETQILWGIRDFRHRFGRNPEGMWLPETAVDTLTLDLMAKHSIRFTVLAPSQARRVRKLGGDGWTDVDAGSLDVSRPYLCKLPSGRTIALFFYNGPLSQKIAFQNLLADGHAFAKKLAAPFGSHGSPELVSVATDGETYGHHHRFGDMALAFALDHLEKKERVHLTVFGEYLDRHRPTHEAEIHENTSWSCAHGVGRWMTDCGCSTGGQPEWSQQWRGPLREAMNWLRDHLVDVFERRGDAIFADPWEARNDYISVMLDPESNREFLAGHTDSVLTHGEKVTALKLLEMQRHGLLMFASCGWFFDEISGLEPVQVMSHAARAMQLAREVDGADLEPGYLEILEQARSNLPELGNGREVYEAKVAEQKADLLKIGACHAAESLFSQTLSSEVDYHCYEVRTESIDRLESGRLTFCSGRSDVRHPITLEEVSLVFAALNLGDHNVAVAVGHQDGSGEGADPADPARKAFLEADVVGTIRRMQSHFQERVYDLSDLFEESRRRVQASLLSSARESLESCLKPIFKEYSHTLQAVRKGQSPLPKVLEAAWELVLNADLQRALEADPVDPVALDLLSDQAERWTIKWDKGNLEPLATEAIDRMARNLSRDPLDLDKLEGLDGCLRSLGKLGLNADLWLSQNVVYEVVHSEAAARQAKKAQQEDSQAKRWKRKLHALAGYIGVKT